MIGIDIVSNERIKKAIERFGDRFLRRVYTEKEITYCKSKPNMYQCLSARWACKEAVIKAFYQEYGVILRFFHIEILGFEGLPAHVNILWEDAKKVLQDRGIFVSLSHEKDYSVAVAIIVGKS